MADKSSIEITGDYAELERALGESASLFDDFGEHIEETASSVDTSWLKVGESIKEMAGAVSTVWTMVSGHIAQQFEDVWYSIKKGTQAFIELTAQVTKLGGVLRTTGMNAGFTAKGLETMNDQMKNLSVNSTEAIRDAQMVLLGFKNVRGDVFKDAIKSAMDFAAVTSGSLSSAVEHYGRLLNDPVKGLTELAESGVTFSASQVKLIEGLLKANDALGLQQAILSKLTEIYGGEAKRQANNLWGSLERLNNIFNDMWTSIGSLLAPTLVNKFIPIMEKVAKVVKAVVTYLDDNGEAIGKAFDRAMVVVEEWAEVVMTWGIKAFAVLQTVVQNWELTWRTVWTGMQVVAMNTMAFVLEKMVQLGEFLKSIWEQAAAFVKPWSDLVISVLQSVADFAVDMWDGVLQAATWAWENIGKVVVDWAAATVGAISVAYFAIKIIVTAIYDVFALLFKGIYATYKPVVEGMIVATGLFFEGVKTLALGIYTTYKTVFQGFATVVGTVFSGIYETYKTTFDGMMVMGRMFLDGWLAIFSGVGAGADSVFKKIFDWLKALGFNIMNNVFTSVKVAMDPAFKALDAIGKKFGEAKEKAAGAAEAIKKKFGDAFAGFQNMPGIDKVIGDLRKRAGDLGGDFDKAFGEFKDKFGVNLAADNKIFDEWKQKIKEIIDSEEDIETMGAFKPTLPRDRESGRGGRGDQGNLIEDLRDFRRRIEEAAAKSPEAEATDKQSDLMRAMHAEDQEQGRQLILAVKSNKPLSDKKNIVHNAKIFDVVNGFDGGGF